MVPGYTAAFRASDPGKPVVLVERWSTQHRPGQDGAGRPEEALEKVIAKILVGRLGEPDEIAHVVEFLAGPDSGFITGQVYSANGGQYM